MYLLDAAMRSDLGELLLTDLEEPSANRFRGTAAIRFRGTAAIRSDLEEPEIPIVCVILFPWLDWGDTFTIC